MARVRAGPVRRCGGALVIGASLAFAVGLFATGLGLDRDRAFYPVVIGASGRRSGWSWLHWRHMACSISATALSSPIRACHAGGREFCLAYDVTAAAYLTWLLKRRRIRAAAC